MNLLLAAPDKNHGHGEIVRAEVFCERRWAERQSACIPFMSTPPKLTKKKVDAIEADFGAERAIQILEMRDLVLNRSGKWIWFLLALQRTAGRRGTQHQRLGLSHRDNASSQADGVCCHLRTPRRAEPEARGLRPKC